jgi:transcriptional regulator with XRE-family HTH domain
VTTTGTTVDGDRESLVEFGRRLRKARIRAGYSSLTDFARLIGATKQGVTLWERGQRQPSFETVWRLEVLLRTTPGDFVALTHPQYSQARPVTAEQAIEHDRDLGDDFRESLLGVLAAYRRSQAPPS